MSFPRSLRRRRAGDLVRHSATYAAGDLLEKAIGLAMLPAYVYFLAPAEFGIIALVGTVTGLGGAVLSLGVYQSIVRLFHNPPGSTGGRQVVGAAWMLLVLVPAAAILALLAVGEPVLGFLLEGIPYARFILLVAAITYCNVAFIEVALAVTRTTAMVRQYVTVVLLRAALTAVFALTVLIATDRPSAFEVVCSQALATLLCSVYSIRLLRPEAQLTGSALAIGPILRFGIPLMPMSSAQWALRVQDRLVLVRFVPLGDIGIYAVLQRLASPMQIVMNASLRTLQPMMSRAAREGDAEELRSALVQVFGVGTIICVFGSLLAPTVTRALLPSTYDGWAELTVLLVPGLFAAAVFQLASSASAFYRGRTYRVTTLMTVAAGVNVVLNLTLVPLLGIRGAALASLLTYVVLAVIGWIVSPLPALLASMRCRLLLTIVSATALLTAGAWINGGMSPRVLDGPSLVLVAMTAVVVQAFVVSMTIRRRAVP